MVAAQRLRQMWCWTHIIRCTLGEHFIQALFIIFLKIFLMFTIFKVFVKFIVVLLLFHDLVFWLQIMWDLSSLTRDWTHIPHSGRSLNHWTTRSLSMSFDKGLLYLLRGEIEISLSQQIIFKNLLYVSNVFQNLLLISCHPSCSSSFAYILYPQSFKLVLNPEKLLNI